MSNVCGTPSTMTSPPPGRGTFPPPRHLAGWSGFRILLVHRMTSPERIVVIDDNANDVQVTRRFLERRGFVVSAATSGAEGLAIAQTITPDAFVVDYRMPAMDGFEVTRRIKADPAL